MEARAVWLAEAAERAARATASVLCDCPRAELRAVMVAAMVWACKARLDSTPVARTVSLY